MTTATEIRNIMHNAIHARRDMGKEKAYEALNVIDEVVYYAAKECLSETEVFILRMKQLDTLDERQAYIDTIKEELKNNGYHVAFSPGTGALKIAWGF